MILESSCVMKETIGIDILKTSRNRDKKIMEPIRIASEAPTISHKNKDRNQFSQLKENLPKKCL